MKFKLTSAVDRLTGEPSAGAGGDYIGATFYFDTNSFSVGNCAVLLVPESTHWGLFTSPVVHSTISEHWFELITENTVYTFLITDESEDPLVDTADGVEFLWDSEVGDYVD